MVKYNILDNIFRNNQETSTVCCGKISSVIFPSFQSLNIFISQIFPFLHKTFIDYSDESISNSKRCLWNENFTDKKVWFWNTVGKFIIPWAGIRSSRCAWCSLLTRSYSWIHRPCGDSGRCDLQTPSIWTNAVAAKEWSYILKLSKLTSSTDPLKQQSKVHYQKNARRNHME